MERASLNDLYQDEILDHCRNPRNVAVVESPDASAHAVNPFCGDEVTIQIAMEDGRVARVGQQAVGCAINQATSSMLGEALLGRSREEIDRIAALFRSMMRGEMPSQADRTLMAQLPSLDGVLQYPVRIKCTLLSFTALEDALNS